MDPKQRTYLVYLNMKPGNVVFLRKLIIKVDSDTEFTYSVHIVFADGLHARTRMELCKRIIDAHAINNRTLWELYVADTVKDNNYFPEHVLTVYPEDDSGFDETAATPTEFFNHQAFMLENPSAIIFALEPTSVHGFCVSEKKLYEKATLVIYSGPNFADAHIMDRINKTKKLRNF